MNQITESLFCKIWSSMSLATFSIKKPIYMSISRLDRRNGSHTFQPSEGGGETTVVSQLL